MQRTEKPESIVSRVHLNVSIPRGTIVDIETTGLDPNRDEIITLGYVAGSQLIVLQRTAKRKDKFYEAVRTEIGNLPRPLYAYNAEFEELFIRQQLGLKREVVKDLFRPWRDRADAIGMKWPKLDDLVSEPEIYFQDKRITGRDVPVIWRRFLAKGDTRLLEPIVKHNQSDLLRSLYLLVQYGFLYKTGEAKQ